MIHYGACLIRDLYPANIARHKSVFQKYALGRSAVVTPFEKKIYGALCHSDYKKTLRPKSQSVLN
ncbi:MAG: hypothetical protein A2538_00020 [Candidatus Magasanikbacteria bacterium RIFOXYD2_FULL_41_14]|uniref:Uncharacterized protein n=1 Tax=Candidatus Magasanikbacteria bacterium RIFOXYD2_FULL_41_14 TaxID=1798709 RepID=A0A1F6PEG9_9BACT|nr:MAG: hypothetical protein A2538_00020 [Candidatus Magasanikbacteria bacterium RIFOXYD2_FULL_41_14]